MDFSTASLDLTKCDIFSLGASVYEVARGARLALNGAEWHSLRKGNLVFHPENPEVTSALLSPSFMALIQSMLAPDPQRRPSARQLLKHPLLRSKSEAKLALAEAVLRNRGNIAMNGMFNAKSTDELDDGAEFAAYEGLDDDLHTTERSKARRLLLKRSKTM